MRERPLKNVIDLTLGKFLVVGVINTIVGALIMLALYNGAGFGYWLSSAVSYIIGSVVSFVLNRSFTFRNTESVLKTAPRFVLNIAVCYFLAYAIAKPTMYFVLQRVFDVSSVKLIENVAMLFGMGLFTGFNYLGQRYFAFRKQ